MHITYICRHGKNSFHAYDEWKRGDSLLGDKCGHGFAVVSVVKDQFLWLIENVLLHTSVSCFHKNVWNLPVHSTFYTYIIFILPEIQIKCLLHGQPHFL